MKKIALILGALFCTVSAHARLGESLEQCNQRYNDGRELTGNEAVLCADKTMRYAKSGFEITAAFKKNQCVELFFRKPGLLASFSNVEIETLLKANAGPWDWQETPNTIYDGVLFKRLITKRWKLERNAALAILYMHNDFDFITTTFAQEKLAALQQQEKEQKIRQAQKERENLKDL